MHGGHARQRAAACVFERDFERLAVEKMRKPHDRRFDASHRQVSVATDHQSGHIGDATSVHLLTTAMRRIGEHHLGPGSSDALKVVPPASRSAIGS
ncbi:MAG TPA: hypothetical protein VGI86_01610 [Acidimicrobiia bacterium]